MRALLWQPSTERTASSNLHAFMNAVETDWDVSIGDYDELWRWSIEESGKF